VESVQCAIEGHAAIVVQLAHLSSSERSSLSRAKVGENPAVSPGPNAVRRSRAASAGWRQARPLGQCAAPGAPAPSRTDGPRPYMARVFGPELG